MAGWLMITIRAALAGDHSVVEGFFLFRSSRRYNVITDVHVTPGNGMIFAVSGSIGTTDRAARYFNRKEELLHNKLLPLSFSVSVADETKSDLKKMFGQLLRSLP